MKSLLVLIFVSFLIPNVHAYEVDLYKNTRMQNMMAAWNIAVNLCKDNQFRENLQDAVADGFQDKKYFEKKFVSFCEERLDKCLPNLKERFWGKKGLIYGFRTDLTGCNEIAASLGNGDAECRQKAAALIVEAMAKQSSKADLSFYDDSIVNRKDKSCYDPAITKITGNSDILMKVDYSGGSDSEKAKAAEEMFRAFDQRTCKIQRGYGSSGSGDSAQSE